MDQKRYAILYIFNFLSDVNLQKSVWIDGKYFDMYCSSFSEAVNSLDDYNFFDEIEERKYKISDELYQTIDNFLFQIVNFEENDDMISNECWISLTLEAKKIHQELEKLNVWL